MRWRSPQFLVIAFLGAGICNANAEEFRPPRLISQPGNYAACRTIGSPDFGETRDVKMDFSIDSHGVADKPGLPKDSPEWLESLAACAMAWTRFEPEIWDGEAIRTPAVMKLALARLQGTGSDEFAVVGVSDLVTPPRFNPKTRSQALHCVPGSASVDRNSRTVFRLTVAADGRIAKVEPPIGAELWMEELGRCLIEKARLIPGSRDGIAAESQVALPIALFSGSKSEDLESARPPTDPAQFEAALRACYPPDQAAMGSVHFKFDVNADGSVSDARLIQSSGDALLDKAGACILPRLRFEPTKRDGKPVKSNITWELPVRPPR